LGVHVGCACGVCMWGVHVGWLKGGIAVLPFMGCNRRVCRQGLCGVQVHVGWLEGGTAVFAFRGTASKQDGLQDVKIFSRNIDYLQELYPGVKAHMGRHVVQMDDLQYSISAICCTQETGELSTTLPQYSPGARQVCATTDQLPSCWLFLGVHDRACKSRMTS